MATRTLNLTQIQEHIRSFAPRPVVVHHFATWCGPCADEMPVVNNLAADLAEDCGFVIISWDLFMTSNEDGVGTVQAFLQDKGITRDVIIYEGKPDDLIQWFEIPEGTVPHTMVYGPDGSVLFRWDDVLEEESMELLIRVVREGPSPGFPVDVRGATLEQLFNQVALAVIDLLYDDAVPAQTDKRLLAVEATDVPQLVLSFLAQLIHLTQEEGWRFGRVEVKHASETALQVEAWGEQVPDALAGLRHHLAEPQPDAVQVKGGPEGWSAKVRLTDAFLPDPVP